MKTSQKQTLPLGADESTCSQEDFLASPFLSPDSEKERKMTATSGRKLFGRYGKYSPLGSLAKTLLASSRWYSPAVRLRWDVKPLYSKRLTESEYYCDKNTPSKQSVRVLNVKDIPSSRLLFRLVPSERPTAGTGCGLLPTVTAIDSGSGRINKSPSPNSKERPTIALAAKMELLPTPMSTEVRHEQRVKELKEAGGDTLHSRANGETRPNGLMDYMDFHGMLPTPVAQDGKDSTIPKSQTKRLRLPGAVGKNFPPSAGQASLQLNPLFVQEMMGFPEDWLVSPFLDGEPNP